MNQQVRKKQLELFESCRPLAIKFARKASHRNYQEYGDLYQEACLALWKAVLGFKKEREVKFISYCFSAINRQMISCYRKRRREYPHGPLSRHERVDFSVIEIDNYQQQNPEWEEELQRLDLPSVIQYLLRALQPKQAEIVQDYWKEGSMHRVGERFGVTGEWIRVTLKQSYQHMRIFYGEHWDDLFSESWRYTKPSHYKLKDGNDEPGQQNALRIWEDAE